jgi:hypothetical protein
MEMDENLKHLMRQLGTAINESLTESVAVSEALADLRAAGYDIFLLLEATIGFNQRPEESGEKSPAVVESGDLVLNAQDANFLKLLRITLDRNADPSSGRD